MPSAQVPCADIQNQLDRISESPYRTCVRVVRDRDGREFACNDVPPNCDDPGGTCTIYWDEL